MTISSAGDPDYLLVKPAELANYTVITTGNTAGYVNIKPASVSDYKIYTDNSLGWYTMSGSGYIDYAPTPKSKSPTDEWSTPDELYDAIYNVCKFNLDVCASKANYKCSKYYTKEDNGLAKEWVGSCWLSQSRELERWVRKAYESKTDVVCLVPARTDAKWWQQYATKATVIFIEGRLYNNNQRLTFPSAILVFPASRQVGLDILYSIKSAGYNGYVS